MIIGVLRSLEVALGSLVLVHGIPSFAIFVVQSITADFDFQGPVDVLAAFCSCQRRQIRDRRGHITLGASWAPR